MSSRIRSKEIDMVHGPLLGKMIAFTIPIILTSWLQLLFNAADVVIVGRFAGDESLAAVGSTSSLINLCLAIFMGLSVGVNVIVAQAIGASEKDELKSSVHTAIATAGISGLFVAAFGVIFAPILLTFMGSPDDVIGLASIYLRIYFLGTPANFIYNFAAAILRAKGDTSTPMKILTVAGVINVCCNLFAVIVLGMGVAGVAIATVISQYVSMALILWILSREEDALKFSVKELTINTGILKKYIKIGLPAGVQSSLFSLSNVVIQSSINSFGSVIMAGNSAAGNIEGFVWMAMNSVYQTALTFVGQNYGAADMKRVKKVTVICQGMVFVVGVVFGNLVVLFSHQLLGIYSKSEDVIAEGAVRLAFVCTGYFLCGIMDSMVGALRGIGQSIKPMIVSLIGACGLRIVWIATIFQVYRVPWMLYITYPISWIITWLVQLLLFVITYRKICETKAIRASRRE